MNRNVLSRTRDALGQVELEHVAPGQDLYENTWQTDAFIATYYEAVNAGTEAEFEGQRKQVLTTYLDLHWWKYKDRVVRCWTKPYRHFGYDVTSQVEGIHAKCKQITPLVDLISSFFESSMRTQRNYCSPTTTIESRLSRF
ncbi:hypothetical protein PHMEG_0006037 [Phytophthora megakarya]|uniref:Uncharacterized protein n=1 Tax=Phytophthora megakarya TaxID=4795 RepID=A0A225WPP9_9STRA|nr:hypothetical protein PHMEG_0006037 [Phytophthora megakarya]